MPLVMERALYSSTIEIVASSLQETVVGRELTRRTRMLEFGYCAELAKELNYEEILGRVGRLDDVTDHVPLAHRCAGGTWRCLLEARSGGLPAGGGKP